MSDFKVTEDQYLRAARRICILRGIDPNGTAWDEPRPLFEPLWTNQQVVAKDLGNLIMMLSTLDEVIEEDEIEQEAIDEVENVV